MMKTKLLTILFLLLTSGLVFQSCEEDPDPPQVGICLQSPSNDWKTALRPHAERRVNNFGLTYSIAQPTTELSQASNIDAMQKKGAEVIIIVPDGDIKDAAQKVITDGIPVIFVETDGETENYAALVRIENSTLGQTAATYLNDQEGLTKIAIFSIKSEPVKSKERIDGLKAALNPSIEILEIELEAYTSVNGRSATQNILENHTDVQAIYAQDDDVASGVVDALNAVNSLQVKAVVGCGGSAAFLKKIDETTNINLATTTYSPAALMERSVDVANEILNGNMPAETIINLNTELVNRDNVTTYLETAAY